MHVRKSQSSSCFLKARTTRICPANMQCRKDLDQKCGQGYEIKERREKWFFSKPSSLTNDKRIPSSHSLSQRLLFVNATRLHQQSSQIIQIEPSNRFFLQRQLGDLANCAYSASFLSKRISLSKAILGHIRSTINHFTREGLLPSCSGTPSWSVRDSSSGPPFAFSSVRDSSR